MEVVAFLLVLLVAWLIVWPFVAFALWIVLLPLRAALKLLLGVLAATRFLLLLGGFVRPASSPADLGIRVSMTTEYDEMAVVGESYRQDALSRIVGGHTPEGVEYECGAELVREPGNRKDRNAIQVVIAGQAVGYLSRTDAATLQPVLRGYERAGKRLVVPAMIVGGWDRGGGDRGHFGVRLYRVPAQ